MEIFAVFLLTWTFVGSFQWFCWVVRIEDLDFIMRGDIDSSWQWLWAGPAVWFLKLLCLLIQNSSDTNTG